jgi:short-subunit dehydrogenase
MEAVKTALVTGASSGIGYEIAKLFAKDGHNLVIVSRDEEALSMVAEELQRLGAGKVTIIAKDLSVSGAPARVYEQTHLMNIDIDYLVNDAGIGQHGLFVETSIERDMEIIQLNIVALIHLTKLYLKDMIARGSGRILQLASVASYTPTPLLAVYSGTKAFVLSFTDSLINELKDTDITVTALIPGPTDTDFFTKAKAENTKAAQGKMSDPADVAKAGYEGLMKGERHAVAGASARMRVALNTILPSEAVTSMARKEMEEEEDEKK